MKSWRWLFSYTTTAVLGLLLAFCLSVQFISPAHSQTPSAPSGASRLEAPGSGDLPPEFAAEMGGAGPAASGATPSATSNKPPTSNSGPQDPKPSTPPVAADADSSSSDEDAAEAGGDSTADSATATAPSHSPDVSGGYVYDPTGRRDPFKPYRVLSPAGPGGTQSKKFSSIDPLLRWDTERFSVVGILWQVRSPRAMIKDPDGAVYTVTKNSKIGRNHGYIAAIREGEIVVVETLEFEGQTSKETKILVLGK